MNPHFPYSVLDPTKQQIRLLKLLPPSSSIPPPQSFLPSPPPPEPSPFCGCFLPLSRLVNMKHITRTPPPTASPASPPPPERYDGVDCEFVSPLSLTAESENVPYEALSYTWGDTTSLSSIRLDKQPFNVTPNLHAALVALRDPAKPRILWIDAICIDQGDKDEKNWQVPMMGTIYRRATVVNIWLGEDITSSRTKSVLDVVHHSVIDGADYQLRRADGTSLYGYDFWSSHRDVLEALAKRPYWARIWVIQEAILAREIRTLYGKHEINWTLLKQHFAPLKRYWHDGTLTSIVAEDGVSLVPDPKSLVTAAVFRGNWATLINDAPASTKVVPRKRPLVELLHKYWEHACSDPRDKVYGLLSLASDVTSEPLGQGLPLRYGKPLAFVYLDVLHLAMVKGNSWAELAALSFFMQKAFGVRPTAEMTSQLYHCLKSHPQAQDQSFIVNKPLSLSLLLPFAQIRIGPKIGDYLAGSNNSGDGFDDPTYDWSQHRSEIDGLLRSAPWRGMQTLDYHCRESSTTQPPDIIFNQQNRATHEWPDGWPISCLPGVLYDVDEYRRFPWAEDAHQEADLSSSILPEQWEKYRLVAALDNRRDVLYTSTVHLALATDQARDGDWLAWLEGCLPGVVLRRVAPPDNNHLEGSRYTLIGRFILQLVKPCTDPRFVFDNEIPGDSVLRCAKVPPDIFQVLTCG